MTAAAGGGAGPPTITAWRIYKPRFAATAWTGEGARRHAGRFHSKGTAVVYVAGSYALAALETLVHLDSLDVTAAFEACSVTFDASLVTEIQLADLPLDWTAADPPAAVRAIGDQWVRDRRSAVLRVPSVIVPVEHNYLVNPAHPDFGRLAIGTPVMHAFDPRLLKR